jgi:hypothetical protein
MIRWLRSLFAWSYIGPRGAWEYYENKVTGRRMAVYSGAGSSPVDFGFLRDGDIIHGPYYRLVVGKDMGAP